MIESDSEDHHSPERQVEEINVYNLIEAAKPVISPTRQLAKEIPFKATLVNRYITKRFHKGLFRRDGTIENYPFSCNFECGNIRSVVLGQGSTFMIQLKDDTNSIHASSWFYFQVKGIKHATYVVRGLPKPNLLYTSGMKVCVREKGIWRRGGTNISYEKDYDGTYSLQFGYSASSPEYIVDFAYCFPYSFSTLRVFLEEMCKRYGNIVSRDQVCKSILGKPIEVLTFGSGSNKPLIIVMARVHPSESVASFMAYGLIKWLCTHEDATQLLQFFEIQVIPMVNPDGVTKGNHRFSFTGVDLNRKWKKANQKLQPYIFFIRNYILQIDPKRIKMIVDLHGHSRKKGVFFYGCYDSKIENYDSRQFPYLMSKISNVYEYNKSCFKVQHSKYGTARIYLWKILKIPCIYTLECSLCGPENTTNNFEVYDFRKVGSDLGKGFHMFFSDYYKQLNKSTVDTLEEIRNYFMSDQAILNTEYNSYGSDSCPSEGELDEEEMLKILKETPYAEFYYETSTEIKRSASKPTGISNTDPRAPSSNSRNFRKKVSTSHQFDRRKKVMSTFTKIDPASALDCSSRLNTTNQNPPLFLSIKRAYGYIRTQFLDELLLKNDIDLQDGRLARIDSLKKSKNKEKVANYEPTSSRSFYPTDTEGMQKNGFYGAQYVRVKKYAEKILREQQKKQEIKYKPQGITTERRPRPTAVQDPSELRLYIIPLKAKHEVRSNLRDMPSTSYASSRKSSPYK